MSDRTKVLVREPAVAGTWYPGDKHVLARRIDELLLMEEPAEIAGVVRAVIVPHAGYPYSGSVAAAAFRVVGDSYRTVILMGPSHRYPLDGVSVPDYTHFRTPLGLVPVSALAEDFRRSDMVRPVNQAHELEHCLELELPFLQTAVPDLEFVPMLVGRCDARELARLLDEKLTAEDLIVVSVDLSHFHSYVEAQRLDEEAIEHIVNLDADGIARDEIDAPWAVSALLHLARDRGWSARLLKYTNSGDVTGDRGSVVGYAAVALVE